MKKLLFAFVVSVLLVSCVSKEKDGEGLYFFDNRSHDTVHVVACTKMQQEPLDTTLAVPPDVIATISEGMAVRTHFTPSYLCWLRVYSTSWQLLYEQNPIDENSWSTYPRYDKGYGFTLNIFVFTDSLIQR